MELGRVWCRIFLQKTCTAQRTSLILDYLRICCWFVHAPRKRTQRTQIVQNYLLGPNHWQIAVKRLSKLGLNLDHALPAGNAKRMLMVSYREKISWW